MDAPVPRAALAPNRDRGRAPSEIESELLLEGLAEFVALKVIKEFAERGPAGKLGGREASALRDLRVVRVDLRPRLGADKAGNDKKFEWLARQRNRFQGFEVERTQKSSKASQRLRRWRDQILDRRLRVKKWREQGLSSSPLGERGEDRLGAMACEGGVDVERRLEAPVGALAVGAGQVGLDRLADEFVELGVGEARAGAADERMDGRGHGVGELGVIARARADEAGCDKSGDEAAFVLAPAGDLRAGPGQGQETEREPLGDVGAAATSRRGSAGRAW